jgi:hypothetical protein
MSSGDGKPKASTDEISVLPKGDKGKGRIRNKFRNKQKQKEQKPQTGYSGYRYSTPKFDGSARSSRVISMTAPTARTSTNTSRRPRSSLDTSHVTTRMEVEFAWLSSSSRSQCSLPLHQKSATPSDYKKLILSAEMSNFVKEKSILQQGIEALYLIMWGQCTKVMRQRLEALPNHSTIAASLDGVELLKEVTSLAYNYQSQKFVGSSFTESFKALAFCMQDKHTVQDYQYKFQNTVDVFEATGRSRCPD